MYEDPQTSDGLRVFVDRLWPRGMKKEAFHYDTWAKDITPSTALRKWFHEDPEKNWEPFAALYKKELDESQTVKEFLRQIRKERIVTLLYASKSPDHNHAKVLQSYLEEKLQGK